MSESYSEAFVLITELATALGATSINKLPGCWEHRLGDRWFVAVNGHSASTKTSTGCDVPPFHAYVELDGWPCGLLTAAGGSMLGHGSEIEDELIAELKRALAVAGVE